MDIDLDLDDELVSKARDYTGIADLSQLLTYAIQSLIETEKRRRAWDAAVEKGPDEER